MEKPGKQSAIDKVVGRDDAQSGLSKEGISQAATDKFRTQDFEDLEKMREKTEAEKHLVKLANDASNRMLLDYGFDEFNVPEKNVHIQKKETWDVTQAAHAIPRLGAIVIKEGMPRIVCTRLLLEEMIHMKMHNKLQIPIKDDPEPVLYRGGLTIVTRDSKSRALDVLNEGLVQELVTKYMKKIIRDPVFSEEQEQTKKIIRTHTQRAADGRRLADFPDIYYATTTRSDISGETTVDTMRIPYQEEREIFGLLSKKMAMKSRKNEEKIFDMFVQASLTGNISPLVRLVDTSFGKGTFRQIAELDRIEFKTDSGSENLQHKKEDLEKLKGYITSLK